MSPTAQFGYIINGLEVTFTSLSLNVDQDSTYNWDFGDTIGLSTEENPVYTFTNTNFFNVKLTVINSDLTSNTSEVIINLTGQPPANLFNNIGNLIDLYSPTNIVGTINHHAQKEFLIGKWQSYLQPLVYDPSVEFQNTYIESSWPPLANSLIAKLVVLDIIYMISAKFLITTAEAGGNSEFNSTSSSSSTSTSSQQPGSIKSIETGPTKVERYENKDVSSTSEKQVNISKAYKELTTKGGFLDQLKDSICIESKRINVELPFCQEFKRNVGFVIGKCN